jgi:hypothetical protein
MRRRLSTTHDFPERCVTAARALRASTGVDHGIKGFAGPRKKKPGGGNAGSDFFVIGVYGFKYAAWLVLVTLESASGLFLLSSQLSFLVLLLSCSSVTFRNLTEPFAISHRILSVCALTRPWVGTTGIKQDTCHGTKYQRKQQDTLVVWLGTSE